MGNNKFKGEIAKMWQNITIKNVDGIKKCVGEFEVSMTRILPYAKMKIKIYESSKGVLTGYTDIRLIRKFDKSPESAVGWGNTIEEVLEDTILYFNQMLEKDYPDGLPEIGISAESIEYAEPSDF